MKDIKKLLKEQSKEILPDERVKRSIAREMGYEESGEVVYAGGNAAAKRKKIYIPLVAALLALAVALAVLLPVLLSNRNASLPNPFDKFAQITDADSFYAYGALSAGTLLASRGETGTFSARADEGIRAVTKRAAVSLSGAREGANASSAQEDALTGKLNGYMSLVESLLSEEAIAETPIAPLEGYDFAMAVAYTDLQGISVRYELHYNKTFAGGEREGDEAEENYAIDGILVADGATYPATGVYQTETEGTEESESELYFRAYLDESRQTYLEVRQESESETEGAQTESEREFSYTLYESGRRADRISLSYEQEEGETELEMRIESGSSRDTLYFSLLRGESGFAVHGSVDGQQVRFRVYASGGMYRYEFEDGSHFDQGRPGHDDDDGDGDHDEDDFDDDDDDDDD